jgi:hypothetical protein
VSRQSIREGKKVSPRQSYAAGAFASGSAFKGGYHRGLSAADNRRRRAKEGVAGRSVCVAWRLLREGGALYDEVT